MLFVLFVLVFVVLELTVLFVLFVIETCTMQKCNYPKQSPKCASHGHASTAASVSPAVSVNAGLHGEDRPADPVGAGLVGTSGPCGCKAGPADPLGAVLVSRAVEC